MKIELIDREAALKEMCSVCCSMCGTLGKCVKRRDGDKCVDYDIDKCVDYNILANQPVIDAEPVQHGRWEKHKDFLDYCTICGAVISLPHHKFCGNCGAKNEKGGL